MTRTRRLAVIPVTLVLMLSLAGCEKAREAAKAINRYAVALDGAQQVEINAFRAGFISKDEHRAAQQAFIKAAQTGKSLNQSLVTALQGGDPQAQLAAAQASLDALVTGLGVIKNEQKRAELQLVVTALKPLLANVIILVQEVKRGSR